MVLTLVSFLVTVTKYLEKQLKDGGFVLSHCSSVRRLMVGQPEMGANGLIVSIVKTQWEMNGGAQWFSLFIQSPSPWNDAVHTHGKT